MEVGVYKAHKIKPKGHVFALNTGKRITIKICSPHGVTLWKHDLHFDQDFI